MRKIGTFAARCIVGVNFLYAADAFADAVG